MRTIYVYALGALAFSFVTTFAITPLTARVARRFGILDVPHEGVAGHKRHAVETPYLGGIAIFLGLLVGAPLLVFLAGESGPVRLLGAYLPVIAIGIGLGLVGLLDDVRHLPRTVRLVAQLAAAVGAYAAGFGVEALPWEAANFAVTVAWIVGITNAFNLLDNMDGLSAGLAGIAAASFALMAAVNGLSVVSVVAAAVAGAAFGFLAHNRHPAKVFMGDAGALFLGFLLAVVGIRLRFENIVAVTFLVPVVALGLPIFDTTLVVLSRLRHRRPVFAGGRDHVSHRLVRVGLPVRAAVGLLFFAGLCLGWLGLVISRASPEIAWMLLTFVAVVGLFTGALLWRVPVYADDSGYQPLPEDEVVDPDEIVAETLEEERAAP